MKIVDRGAAFLDETMPGWFDLIDTQTLDLADARRCIVGQIERRKHPRRRSADPFTRGLADLGIGGYGRAARLGFMQWGNARYDNITRAWLRVIEARRS